MEEGRILFDASAYLLFEATGDSEGACNFDAAFDDSDAAAEDDAQSCSYGSSCASNDRRMHEVVDGGDYEITGGEFEYGSGEEEDSDEEDGVVDQCLRKEAAEPAKSKGFEESNELMSEREGDKQFWEACLAS